MARAGPPAIPSASICAVAIRVSTPANSPPWTAGSAATSMPPPSQRRPGHHAATGHRPPGPVPTIVLDPKVTHTSRLARAHHDGRHRRQRPRDVYRMDEVPLPQRSALKSPYPTDEPWCLHSRAVAKRPQVPSAQAFFPRVDKRPQRSGSPAESHCQNNKTASSRTSARRAVGSSPTSRVAALLMRRGAVFLAAWTSHTHVAGRRSLSRGP
jgi:hypothetical protein